MKKKLHLKQVVNLLISGIVLSVIITFFGMPVMIKGDSMAPTLMNQQRVLLIKDRELQRFDLVVFTNQATKKRYVKRLIGLPGDQLSYHDDNLYINGQIYPEPFLDEFKAQSADGRLFTKDFSIETIPENQYFVLGDNRRISQDSRSFGLINQEQILGRTWLRFWPLNRITLVSSDT